MADPGGGRSQGPNSIESIEVEANAYFDKLIREGLLNDDIVLKLYKNYLANFYNAKDAIDFGKGRIEDMRRPLIYYKLLVKKIIKIFPRKVSPFKESNSSYGILNVIAFFYSDEYNPEKYDDKMKVLLKDTEILVLPIPEKSLDDIDKYIGTVYTASVSTGVGSSVGQAFYPPRTSEERTKLVNSLLKQLLTLKPFDVERMTVFRLAELWYSWKINLCGKPPTASKQFTESSAGFLKLKERFTREVVLTPGVADSISEYANKIYEISQMPFYDGLSKIIKTLPGWRGEWRNVATGGRRKLTRKTRRKNKKNK